MGQATGSRTAKRRKRASAKPDGGFGSEAPPALARTSVCKRVPIAVRTRLDEAILLRPDDCPTLEAIADKFALTDRYGIKGPALRTYARRLEQCEPSTNPILSGSPPVR